MASRGSGHCLAMLSNQLLSVLVGVFPRLQIRQTPQALSRGEGGEWAARPPCPLRPVAPGTEQNLFFKSLGSYFWLSGYKVILWQAALGWEGGGAAARGWRCGCFCSRSAAALALCCFSPESKAGRTAIPQHGAVHCRFPVPGLGIGQCPHAAQSLIL